MSNPNSSQPQGHGARDGRDGNASRDSRDNVPNQESRGDRDTRTWPEKYAAHEQAMLDDDEKRRMWDAYASRPEAVAEMPSGLFGQTSPLPEERTVGKRRNTLLRKNRWTDDHQEFHDYYYERLKYDFKKEWEANQESRGDRDTRTWPEKYAAHEQAMLDDDEKRRMWDAYASRPEAVAEMPSGLFGQRSPIPEESTVGRRRAYLLGKNRWTDDQQEFHDFYYERLRYDFKKEWHDKHNVPLPTE